MQGRAAGPDAGRALRRPAFLLLLLAATGAAWGQAPAPVGLAQGCALWQATERQVRDSRIPRALLRRHFLDAYQAIQRAADWPTPAARWVFPLPGYSAADFDPASYQPRGFDYYRGTRGGAPHPAVDIFIFDRGQRCRDDRDGGAVPVVAVFSGVVVSVQGAWRPEDRWRGGCYVYVLDPVSGQLAYYAHLSETWVEPGDRLAAGACLGTVGRSGKNAFMARSATHLHLMWMAFKAGSFAVLDPVAPLRKASLLPRRRHPLPPPPSLEP